MREDPPLSAVEVYSLRADSGKTLTLTAAIGGDREAEPVRLTGWGVGWQRRETETQTFYRVVLCTNPRNVLC